MSRIRNSNKQLHRHKAKGSERGPKPDKPYPDFPLFPHATRRWAKKIRGKLYYFGPWHDPQGALDKYLDQKDDLYAGREPRPSSDGLVLRDLLNRFLTAKEALVDTGEIVARTFQDYHATCKTIGEAFGFSRIVEDLDSNDFEQLRRRAQNEKAPLLTVGVEGGAGEVRGWLTSLMSVRMAAARSASRHWIFWMSRARHGDL